MSSSPEELVRRSWSDGASAVELVRADSTRLHELQIGGFFATSWRGRLLRRVLLRSLPRRLLSRLPRELAADVAFWRGVRSRATRDEWRHLTRSSYVVLYYHRVAGERKPGQERLDVSPATFERQLRWVRRLGLRPLSADDVIAFHSNGGTRLSGRSFVLAADDGFRDATTALARHLDLRPFLFVPTAAVGGSATWMDGEQIASWPELVGLSASGAEIGSHTQTHPSLPDLEPDALTRELEESLRDLRACVPEAPAMLAYPHGRNDERVRAATEAAGYRIAFTTDAGRNGAGTDPYRLRRVELKEWDGRIVVAWKALTGEFFPWPIERWKFRLFLLRRGRHRSSKGST